MEKSGALQDEPEFKESWTPWLLPLLLPVFCLMPFFASYSVELSAGTLRFGFNTFIFSTSLEKDEIESVEKLDKVHPLRDYGGWGLRISPDGTTGYIVNSGPALKIHIKGGKKYVFNVKEAEKLLQLLL